MNAEAAPLKTNKENSNKSKRSKEISETSLLWWWIHLLLNPRGRVRLHNVGWTHGSFIISSTSLWFTFGLWLNQPHWRLYFSEVFFSECLTTLYPTTTPFPPHLVSLLKNQLPLFFNPLSDSILDVWLSLSSTLSPIPPLQPPLCCKSRGCHLTGYQ